MCRIKTKGFNGANRNDYWLYFYFPSLIETRQPEQACSHQQHGGRFRDWRAGVIFTKFRDKTGDVI